MRHSCLRTRIRVFHSLPELKTRFRPHQEGNSGSIYQPYFPKKSARNPFGTFCEAFRFITGGSSTDVKELTNRFLIPAARLVKDTAKSSVTYPLEGTPRNPHRNVGSYSLSPVYRTYSTEITGIKVPQPPASSHIKLGYFNIYLRILQ
jgi:hypothetical protein